MGRRHTIMGRSTHNLRKTAMENINISTQLLNQIMGYLGTRPYQEVFQLINGVQQEVQANTNQISTPDSSAE